MRFLLFFALVVISNVFASESIAAEHPPGTLKFSPIEFYTFNLGGESGQYTDWEKLQISRFDGLATTIDIQEIKGKPKDKWASIARINLYGEGEKNARKMLSLIFTGDRKTRKIRAELWRGGDTPRHPIDVELSEGKPINLSLVATATNEFLLSIDDLTATIENEFEVKSIQAIGSGVDVKFSPFNLLEKSTSE